MRIFFRRRILLASRLMVISSFAAGVVGRARVTGPGKEAASRDGEGERLPSISGRKET